MPFSTGTFSRVHDWTSDRDAGIKISASRTDAEFDGIATGLTTCILKDGTQTLTAMIPFTLGLSVPTDKKIQLRDSAIFINSSADGQLNMAADTSVTITTPSLIITDNTTDEPIVQIKNTHNGTTAGELRFVMDKGAAGADGDDLGTISFFGDDAGQNQTAFAKIVGEVSEADDTDEAGKLSFFVAESDGTNTALTAGLILEGEHATDGEVDVTIGAGIASTTSVSGVLNVAGGAVFNEDSADVDFRIESNDSANMFFVDGGNNLVTLQNDSDTDYNTNQTASNTVLNLKNTTSGASNSVGLSFSTEANGEQYITAVQVSDNSRSDLTFGARNGGSRTETMRIAGDGHLLLNMQTSLQSGYLSIEGQGKTRCINLDADSSSGGLIGFFFGDSAVGNINTNGSITNYQTSSDYRLKENVSYNWDATTRLKQLKPARFNFKKDADKTLDGFLAHEVSSIVPEAISGTKDGTEDLGIIKDKDGNVTQENALEIYTKKDEGETWTKTKTEDVYQGIDQSKLVPLLVKTIQELEARVTALESA